MPKFRKKPVVIEAVEYVGVGEEDGTFVFATEPPAWLLTAINKNVGEPGKLGLFNGKASIVTLEGDHTVSPGDFIICGVKGELYSCKPDIFLATYDEVK